VEPGRLSSRVSFDKRSSIRVVLKLKEVSEEVFETIVSSVASDPIILTHLYNNQLSDRFFLQPNVKENLLFNMEDISVLIEDEVVDVQNEKVAAVFEKFVEQILGNPILFLTFRGHGAEQFLHDVREARAETITETQIEAELVGMQEIKRLTVTPEEFFKGSSMENFTLTVRADELPASLLRRLDPLPTNGGLDFVDKNLEMAYERITRLAQSLARFL